MPVTLRVANGDVMEGGLEEAEISLEFIQHEQLSRPDPGGQHQNKGLFHKRICRNGTCSWDLTSWTCRTPEFRPTDTPCSFKEPMRSAG